MKKIKTFEEIVKNLIIDSLNPNYNANKVYTELVYCLDVTEVKARIEELNKKYRTYLEIQKFL